MQIFTLKAGGQAGGRVVKRCGSKSTEQNDWQPATSFGLHNQWRDTIIDTNTKSDCDYTKNALQLAVKYSRVGAQLMSKL